jgi:hypothetical protein
MKSIFKLLKWLLIIGVVLLVVLVLARNFVARVGAEIVARQVTGFPLAIESVDIGWGKLAVANLKMSNPADFEERSFVDLPEFRMDYDTVSMLKVSPHVRELSIKLNEVVLVTNEGGESNVGRLTASKSSKPGTTPPPKKKTPYRVDLVRIQVSTVRFVDCAKGKATERKMVLNLNQTYKNIDENTDITALVFGTVLGNVNIPELRGVTDSLTKVTGGVGDTLQKTSDGLLGIIKKK